MTSIPAPAASREPLTCLTNPCTPEAGLFFFLIHSTPAPGVGGWRRPPTPGADTETPLAAAAATTWQGTHTPDRLQQLFLSLHMPVPLVVGTGPLQHWHTARLCREREKKLFNKTGQTAMIRHKAQPDRCCNMSHFTHNSPLFYYSLPVPPSSIFHLPFAHSLQVCRVSWIPVPFQTRSPWFTILVAKHRLMSIEVALVVSQWPIKQYDCEDCFLSLSPHWFCQVCVSVYFVFVFMASSIFLFCF